MRKNRLFRGLKFFAVAIVAVTVFGFVTMHLWNWLMPVLFGWKLVTLWQALGLIILGRVLFGGFRGPGRRHWRHRMMDRWEQMSPEEREKFREGMRNRCGRPEAPAAKVS